MLILALEQAIIIKLKADLTDVQILPFPNDPAELGRPVNAKQIYVGFKSERLEESNSITLNGRVPPQRRKLDYELILRFQDLRSHQVVYPAMDRVRESITGYRPDIPSSEAVLTSGFRQTQGGFVDFGAGLWLYAMTLSIDSVFTSKTQPSWGVPIRV
jgi:Gp37 protein